MSIEGKHFYRFNYLKSEHWSNLRLAKLGSVDAKCKVCLKRDLSNDVHHIVYRNLYDVQLSDLVVVCRDCHNQVHAALERCQTMKERKTAKLKWSKTINSIRRDQMRKKREDMQQAVKKSMQLFSALRQRLVTNRIIPTHSSIYKPKGYRNRKIIHGMIRDDLQHFIAMCHKMRLFQSVWPIGEH